MIGNNGICMCIGINKNMFNNLNPLTVRYLRKKCGNEIKQIFRGSYKYEKSRVNLLGFKTTNEYKKELAKRKGFKSVWEMEKVSLLKENKSVKEIFDRRAIKRGFKSDKDYKKFLAIKLGFEDFNEYRNFKMKELRGFRSENGLCMKCGGERDSKFKRCLKCRQYHRNRK